MKRLHNFVLFLYNRWLRRELRKVIERDYLPPGKALHELPMHEVRSLLQASRRPPKLS